MSAVEKVGIEDGGAAVEAASRARAGDPAPSIRATSPAAAACDIFSFMVTLLSLFRDTQVGSCIKPLRRGASQEKLAAGAPAGSKARKCAVLRQLTPPARGCHTPPTWG